MSVSTAAHRWAREIGPWPGTRVMPTRIRSGLATPVRSHGQAHIVREAATVTDGRRSLIAARWMCGNGSHNVQPLADIGPYRLCRTCNIAAEYDTRGPVVYRAFSAAGDLLYIGVTSKLGARVAQHAQGSIWWPLLDHFDVESFPTYADAERAESVAIAHEHPRYNRLGRTA